MANVGALGVRLWRVGILGLAFTACMVRAQDGHQSDQAQFAQRPPEKRQYDQRQVRFARESAVPFVEPPVLCSRCGILSTTLRVQFADNPIGEVMLHSRTYNGGLPGPTLRVRPGDRLHIRLANLLPPGSAATSMNMPGEPDMNPNQPHGPDVTNLHTHGLHVSPEDPADNVFVQIGPGQYHDYRYCIRPDHVCGTFWYHAHKHGSVAYQLASGMAGALIVEGGIDYLPGVREAADMVLVFQQINYTTVAPGKGEITPEDIYGRPFPQKTARAVVRDPYTTINGVIFPVIKMAPGEVQRWRMIHAGIEDSLPLSVGKVDDQGNITERVRLQEIAVDGLPLGKLRGRDIVPLEPGYRSDVLVKMTGKENETYYLIKEKQSPEVALRGVASDQIVLARIDVGGPPRNMQLPADADLAPFALRHIEDGELVNRDHTLEFNIRSTPQDAFYEINGKVFDPSLQRVDRQVLLNTAEEWTLSSKSLNHPFHIHVNPFEVLVTDSGTGKTAWVWKDTFLVRQTSPPVKVRMRFEDFSGKTVLHCHILDHEDQGMMQIIEILGAAENEAACWRTYCRPRGRSTGFPFLRRR